MNNLKQTLAHIVQAKTRIAGLAAEMREAEDGLYCAEDVMEGFGLKNIMWRKLTAPTLNCVEFPPENYRVERYRFRQSVVTQIISEPVDTNDIERTVMVVVKYDNPSMFVSVYANNEYAKHFLKGQ